MTKASETNQSPPAARRSGGGAHGGVLAALVGIAGGVAVAAWIIYRYGPTLGRFAGIAFWWAGWAAAAKAASATWRSC
jgi:hypothetical protein